MVFPPCSRSKLPVEAPSWKLVGQLMPSGSPLDPEGKEVLALSYLCFEECQLFHTRIFVDKDSWPSFATYRCC